jgi:hypothetical protein
MRRKQYIFGYGSLVSPDDVYRTLGRRVELIYPVELRGWIRDWGVVVDVSKTHRRFKLDAGCPTHIAALNIRRPGRGERPTNPNGVLFAVDEADLAKLDIRESCYERTDVTEDIVDPPADGVIYAYTGLDTYLLAQCEGLEVVIPKPYQDIVVRGFTALGAEVHDAYARSTLISELDVRDFEVITAPDRAGQEHQD